VRRVATVAELAAKLDRFFDGWIRERIEIALPELRKEVGSLFERYEQDRAKSPEELFEESLLDERESDGQELFEERRFVEEEDEGSAETFFAWFFRGKGPARVLSGAAFQKNRLSSQSSVYSTLLEDDHVSWLLSRPGDVIGALCGRCGKRPETIRQELRSHAYHHFSERTQRAAGYPRVHLIATGTASGRLPRA
jgi:hypothetical protein